jgi:hypothetical protein
MATLDSAIKMTGKIGGVVIRYIKSTGKYVASEYSKPSKAVFENSKTNLGTKRGNEELKARSIWSKLVRFATDDLSHLKQGQNNCYLVKIASQIQNLNTTDIVGQRSVKSSAFNFPLLGYSMNKVHPFSTVFHGDPIVSISNDRREVTLVLDNFTSWKKFLWTERVFYYRIYLSISEIPDIVWNKIDGCFDPVCSKTQRNRKTVVSEWMPVDTDPIDFKLVASFAEDYQLRDQTMVMASMGVEFASSILYDTYCIVPGNGTMAIVGCF